MIKKIFLSTLLILSVAGCDKQEDQSQNTSMSSSSASITIEILRSQGLFDTTKTFGMNLDEFNTQYNQIIDARGLDNELKINTLQQSKLPSIYGAKLMNFLTVMINTNDNKEVTHFVLSAPRTEGSRPTLEILEEVGSSMVQTVYPSISQDKLNNAIATVSTASLMHKMKGEKQITTMQIDNIIIYSVYIDEFGLTIGFKPV